MSGEAIFKKCRCGYSIIVYLIKQSHGKPPHCHFLDGHSGDYQQCWVCPGCSTRLDYLTLEG